MSAAISGPRIHRLLPLLCCLAAHAVAQPKDNDALVRSAADEVLRVQVQGLPGQASYTLDTIRTAGLAPCTRVDAQMTPGARSWGRSSVTARCIAGATWSVIVPVRIRVVGPYLVSARAISAGQHVEAADVAVQNGDWGELPDGILTDTAQAAGQLARVALPAGRPLRGDMLRAPLAVRQGQNVKVVSRGAGFEVTNEGKALNSGGAGQVIQVRLPGGQVISGVADANGSVRID